MNLFVRSPEGGFLAIMPVGTCGGCVFEAWDEADGHCCWYGGYQRQIDSPHANVMPHWCPVMAIAQAEIPTQEEIKSLLPKPR